MDTKFANELGWLFQGVCKHKGANTCFFIKNLYVPKGCTYTYGRIVCNYQPQKDEPHRAHLTMGGDCIDYIWAKSTPTANPPKLHFNSTISTPGTSFYGIDLDNFYLTPKWSAKNTCAYGWTSSHKKLLTNTILATLSMPTDGYMSKFKRTYRGYLRLASLQINSSKNALLSEATINVSTHLVCGNTCDATSLFALSWTTLASRWPVWPIWSILSHPLKNTTPLQSTGQVPSSAEAN